MSASNYLENKILDHVLKVAAFTVPTTLYMSLHTADPGEVSANEVVGGSYARQTIAFNAAASGTASNSGAVTFAGMPAVGGSGVTHFIIQDAVSGGNALFIGPLTTPQVLTAGQALTFNAGQVTVGAD